MAGKTLRGVTGYVNLSQNDCDIARRVLLPEAGRVCRGWADGFCAGGCVAGWVDAGRS